jgi:hypothetical protein
MVPLEHVHGVEVVQVVALVVELVEAPGIARD